MCVQGCRRKQDSFVHLRYTQMSYPPITPANRIGLCAWISREREVASLMLFMVLRHLNSALRVRGADAALADRNGYPTGVIKHLTSLVPSVLQGGAGGAGGPYTR